MPIVEFDERAERDAGGVGNRTQVYGSEVELEISDLMGGLAICGRTGLWLDVADVAAD